jgi:hypothetical protein
MARKCNCIGKERPAEWRLVCKACFLIVKEFPLCFYNCQRVLGDDSVQYVVCVGCFNKAHDICDKVKVHSKGK